MTLIPRIPVPRQSDLQKSNDCRTKGEMFKIIYGEGHTFDGAVPQNWLNEITDKVKKAIANHTFSLPAGYTDPYDYILGRVVWYYPPMGTAEISHPVGVTKEAQEIIARFENTAYHGM